MSLTCYFVFVDVRPVLYQKPQDGDKLAAITELPGMGISGAVIRSIKHHLHPHGEDEFQRVRPTQVEELFGEIACTRVQLVT